jgi:hypothetical protein
MAEDPIERIKEELADCCTLERELGNAGVATVHTAVRLIA